MHQALVMSLLLVALASPHTAAAYDKSAFVAPEGQALVVFVQNLRKDRKMSFIVFDTAKQCVAEVGGRQAEVVPMAPGQYTWYVSGYYDNHRILLELEAGRTYFVRLYTVERFGTGKAEVTLVRRATDSYMQLKHWLKGALVTHAKDDPCRGKPLKERQNRTNRRINAANADWKTEGDAYRAAHTGWKEDGLLPKDVEWL